MSLTSGGDYPPLSRGVHAIMLKKKKTMIVNLLLSRAFMPQYWGKMMGADIISPLERKTVPGRLGLRICERWFISSKMEFGVRLISLWASPMAQLKKNQPVVPEAQETRVRALGWEDRPEEENGNRYQYSSLKDPTDREAWWVTVQRVPKSQIWLSD